jgi:hypothetical protein
MTQEPQDVSPRKILLATGSAFLVAILVLLVAILPAEYGIDPLGAGEALGLLALSQSQPIQVQETEYRLDTANLDLLPGEWVEYFYRLEKGDAMVFSWKATGTVSYNFHAQPDDAPRDYAESFDSQENDQAHGSYDAPFSGIHGWYWENVTAERVILKLDTAGFYRSAVVSRDRASGDRELQPLGSVRFEQATQPPSEIAPNGDGSQ